MCRSIVTLRRADRPATDEEVRAAALQFVRKVSGYRSPSHANQAAFEACVEAVASASRRMLDGLEPAGGHRRRLCRLLADDEPAVVPRRAEESAPRS